MVIMKKQYIKYINFFQIKIIKNILNLYKLIISIAYIIIFPVMIFGKFELWRCFKKYSPKITNTVISNTNIA